VALSSGTCQTPEMLTFLHHDDVFWLTVGAVVGLVVGLLVSGRVAGSWHRPVAIALAGSHLGAVIGITLFPVPFGGTPFDLPYGTVQLNPFGTIGLLIDGSQSLRQLGGNLLLLAPMGVLAPVAWRAARPWGRTMAWGLIASVGIEVSQLTLGSLAGQFYRVVDIDDVLLNVAGVAAGRLLFSLGWPIWRRLTDRREP
jgi:glycopeptide antibiotics resistance protein